MLNYIISFFFIYLFFGFILFFFQRKIVFNVSGIPMKPIKYGLNKIQETIITTDDGYNLL